MFVIKDMFCGFYEETASLFPNDTIRAEKHRKEMLFFFFYRTFVNLFSSVLNLHQSPTLFFLSLRSTFVASHVCLAVTKLCCEWGNINCPFGLGAFSTEHLLFP